MSDRKIIPVNFGPDASGAPVPYHQTHTTYGLPACPLCGWKSLVVQSYGRTQQNRSYYVTCEHCAATPGTGSIEGPTRDSAEDAGKAFMAAMRQYAESFMDGSEGEYHDADEQERGA
jgi:hypothetical protein